MEYFFHAVTFLTANTSPIYVHNAREAFFTSKIETSLQSIMFVQIQTVPLKQPNALGVKVDPLLKDQEDIQNSMVAAIIPHANLLDRYNKRADDI